jgi:hypothetical protein
LLQILILKVKKGKTSQSRIDGAERNIFGSATLVLGMLHLHGHKGSLQQFYEQGPSKSEAGKECEVF